jgi:hypothetical protein
LALMGFVADSPVKSGFVPDAAPVAEPSFLDKLLHGLAGGIGNVSGAPEAALHYGTAGIGALGGGLGYLGTLALSGGNTGGAKAVQEDIQNTLTYEPHTEGGKTVVGAISGLGNKVEEGRQALIENRRSGPLTPQVGNQYYGPTALARGGVYAPHNAGPMETPQESDKAATALDVTSQVAPILAGYRGGKGAASTVADNAANARIAAETKAAAAPSTITENLRAMGIKLRPSDAAAAGPPGTTPGIAGRALEGAAGSAEMGRELSIQNIPGLQARAARYIGADLSKSEGRFAPDQPGMPGTFEQLAAPHNAVYGELAKVRSIPQSQTYVDRLGSISTKGSSPTTAATIEKMLADYKDLGSSQDIVSDVRTLRRRATQLIQNENPEFQQVGFAAKKIANAMDDELARRADAAGLTGLANEFKASRVALAKIHTIEDATRAGIIDPKKLLDARKAGIPIEGDAAIIAYAAEHAPHVTKHPLTFSSAGGATHVPTGVGALAQGLLRNVGARGIMNGPYQNALGMAGPESRLSQFFPDHPIQEAPRGPITDQGRLLPAPGEEWNAPTLGVNEGLNPADHGMVPGHPGQAGYTPPVLRLPAPGQTSHLATVLAELLNRGEANSAVSWIARNHPAAEGLMGKESPGPLSLAGEYTHPGTEIGGIPLYKLLKGDLSLESQTKALQEALRVVQRKKMNAERKFK